MADRAGIENRKSLEAWPLDFPEFPTILKQRFSRGRPSAGGNKMCRFSVLAHI
jgi:hypothetical protein